MPNSNSRALRAFCSYSHKDGKLRERLDIYLESLRREGLIEVWNDRRITGGKEWAGQIDDRLRAADIILLLVTANFVASPYCMDEELSYAMDRHERREARVIPIIFRDCLWQNQQFGKLQAFPRDAKPVMSHPRGTEFALLEVTEGIRNVILEDWPTLSVSRLPDPRDTILAHLCNRKEQEIQLKAAWEEHMSKRRQRPFICIVHGGAEEDLEGYRKRLLGYSLPKALGMPIGTEIRRFVLLKWPSDFHGPEAVLKALSSNLASALGSISSEPTVMAPRLSRVGNPAVVCCDVLNSYSNYHRPSIDAFLEYWSGWPDLSFAQAMLVLVSVRYQPGFPTLSAEEIFTSGLEHDKLSTVILRELSAVASHDVKEWIRHPDVMKFCEVESNVGKPISRGSLEVSPNK